MARMKRSRRWLVLSAAIAGVASASGFARACVFDGVFDGGLGTVHPRAIEIALAVRQAVADGVLPEAALAPLSPGEAGLWQAMETLRRVGHHLSTARTMAPHPDIALLCSDASLWTRYVARVQSFDILVHVNEPRRSDVVVVSDLAVLVALVEGRLPLRSAIKRGLIVIDTQRSEADAVERLLAAAFDKPASLDFDVANRMAWGAARLR